MIDALRKRFKIILDFSYSILASIISVAVIQLILYPLLAKNLNSNEYGQLLTIMGIVNTLSSAIGNTLNNTRLIQNSRYEEKELKGDFNIILVYANIVGFIITLFVGLLFFKYNLITLILISVLVILMSIKSYMIVGYRIKINYKLNLLSSTVSSLGYLLGILIVRDIMYWPLIFVISELLNITFVLFTVDLHKEPYKITALFKESLTKYSLLILTSLLGNLLVYLDRLIIYPVLGGESVSIYTTAAIFGKSLGLVMIPIAGVLLSYFSQSNFVMNKRKYWNINLTIFAASTVFFIFTIIAAPWFTGFFYPTLAFGASKYLFYANLAAIISVAANIIQPSVLKFAPTYWQVVKEILYGVVYVGLGLVLLNEYGLLGFCCAAIIANLLRLTLLCIIGTVFIKNDNSKLK